MAGLNRVTVIGNLGREAELKYTPSGAALASFSVAVNEKWKDKSGQMQERTEWVRCTLWGKMAETLSEYLVKGKQVYIEGRLRTDKYEKNGQTQYSTGVVVENVVLLGGGGNGSSRQRSESADAQEPITDDDIPF